MNNFIKKVTFFCVTAILLPAHIKSQDDFSYADTKAWGEEDPICNTGTRQSPLDFDPSFMIFLQYDCPSLKYINYDKYPFVSKLENTGHGVKISGDYDPDTQPYIVVANSMFDGTYIFDSYYLHWSQTSNNGSEHRVLGQGYPAEGQAVHRNNKYSNMDEAMEHEDGLLTLAFFYIVNDGNANGLQPISEGLTQIVDPGSSVIVPKFSLYDIGLQCRQKFYFYQGSITVPPCTQNVKWVICNNPIFTNEEDLNLVRAVNLDYGNTDNIRPTQSYNDRSVYFATCKNKRKH